MYGDVKGFTLIETLVALVILTIGLVGIFNLHLIAKQVSYDAFMQTQASFIARDVINRIQLNSLLSAEYIGNIDSSKSTEQTAVPTSCESSLECTSNQIKSWDLYQIQTQLAGVLEIKEGTNIGGLDSAIVCIDINNNILTVVITWRGNKNLFDAAANQSDFIKTCGIASDRRRVFSLQTVII